MSEGTGTKPANKCKQKSSADRSIADVKSLQTVGRPERKRKVKERTDVWEGQPVTWNTSEKEKLLEALYRHSPSAVESISSIVGTKTPKQVEAFIEKTVNSACYDLKRRRVQGDPDKGAAPLELWLSLVEELVQADKKEDHSKQFSKVIDVISRNESLPKESGFPNLNWNKLYRFISDLLDDKAVLQPLTNIESLVILDMMHNLGDTLHSTDMKEQRQFLDLKYQLYKWQRDRSSRNLTAGLKAHLNDFTNIEYNLTKSYSESSSTSTSTLQHHPVPSTLASAANTSSLSQPSSSSQQLPSTSTHRPNLTPHRQPSKPIANSNDSITPTTKTTTTAAEPTNQDVIFLSLVPQSSPSSFPLQSQTSSTTSTAMPFSSSNSSSSTSPHTNVSPFDLQLKSVSTSKESRLSSSHQDFASAGSTMISVADTIQSSSSSSSTTTTSAVNKSASRATSSSSMADSITSNNVSTSGSVLNSCSSNTTIPSPKMLSSSSSSSRPLLSADDFVLPALISMNPLTIPAHLLSLQPTADTTQIPLVIDVGDKRKH